MQLSTILYGGFGTGEFVGAGLYLEFMDNSSLTRVGHPVVAALDAVSEVLDETVGAEVWSLSDDDLAATIERCEVVAARQAAMGSRLVREADARGAKRLEYTVCPITRQ